MAVTYDVIEDGTVVLEYWSGKVTRDDLVAHENQHLRDPRIRPDASVLVDARAAHFGITPEEVRDTVNGLYANSRQPLKIKKCALLVNDLTYSLARVYEKNARPYGVSIIAFSSLDIACTWLGLDMNIARTHLTRSQKAHSAH